MRIAWVTYGFEEYSSLHVNALCEAHDVLLVMPHPEDEDTYAIDQRVEHYAFNKPRLRQPLRQWMSVHKIVSRIHEFKPDVVHFQQGHLWFNWALRKLRRFPLVVTIHDPRHHTGDVVSQKTPQWVIDYGFRQADHAIVHGNLLADQVQQLFGFSQGNVHVIPHVAMGVEAIADSIQEDPNLVLFFGRIWDYKGLDQLIAAQPLINAELPDARIMIAGRGEDFAKYESLMVDPSKFIVHNDWISDEQRAEFFQRSSLVVLPYNEATQSGVVPVAFNYSKPVVATRVGALVECVDHERTGLLVPPRDPRSLADAIIWLLKNPTERHAIGIAGKSKLQQDWSPTVVAAETANVYEQAIRSRRPIRHARAVGAESMFDPVAVPSSVLEKSS